MGWMRKWTRELRFPWQEAPEEKQEIQSKESEDEYRSKKPTCIDHLLWDIKFRIIYVLLICAILGIAVPIIYTHFNPLIPPDPNDSGTCIIDESLKFRCLSGANFVVNKTSCEAAGCCWSTNSSATVRCYHVYPSRNSYEIVSMNDSSSELTVTAKPAYRQHDLYGTSLIPLIKVSFIALDAQHLVIRFDLHNESTLETPRDSIPLNATEFEIYIPDNLEGTKHLLQFQVRRNKTGEVLLGTTEGPVLFSENYAEFSTLVPTKHLYGLASGLEHAQLHKAFQFERDTLFVQDPSIGLQNNGYHPFYFAFEKSGMVHGVLWDDLSPFPLEIEYLSNPAIAFRAMGRLKTLQIHLLAGPLPADVSQQYKKIVANNYPPVLPPYWHFGLGLCRESLNGSFFDDQFNRMKQLDIPYDFDCIDLNLYRAGFDSLDKAGYFQGQASAYREKLRENSIKFYQAIPPYMDWDNAADLNYPTILNPNGTGIFQGRKLNQKVAYIDFTSMDLLESELLESDLAPFSPLDPDGFLLIDNMPVNEDQNILCEDDYPFVPLNRSYLNDRTVCMDAIMGANSTHLDWHNIYGLLHVKRVFSSIQNETRRIPLMTESSAYGNRGLAGTWVSDYTADWASLRKSLVQVLEAGLMGVPWSGMPICGTLNAKSINTTAMLESLCLKWYQIGLLMPVANVFSRQDQFLRSPADFSGNFARYIHGFMRHRYSLLPYYYTLAFQSAKEGTPIIRPLFYEFPTDNQTLAIQEQFMIGPAIIACPSLYPSQDLVTAYFPQATWYDCFSGDLLVNATSGGTTVQLANSDTQLNVFVRSGSVYVTQDAGENAEQSRKSTYTVTAALGILEAEAEGSLYVDDGQSRNEQYYLLHFRVNYTHAEVQVNNHGELRSAEMGVSTVINRWRIMGFPYMPANVTYSCGNSQGQLDFTYLKNNMLIVESEFDWSSITFLDIEFN